MAAPPTSSPAKLDSVLDEALKAATRSRLENTLRLICASHPEALKDVESALVDATTASPAAGGIKRPRYAVCINPGCYAEFDVRDNDEKSCDWHTGELCVDDSEDFWADHDSDPDTEFNREEFPEGFKWDCCEQKGDSEELGCKIGPHKAEDGDSAKRRQGGR